MQVTVLNGRRDSIRYAPDNDEAEIGLMRGGEHGNRANSWNIGWTYGWYALACMVSAPSRWEGVVIRLTSRQANGALFLGELVTLP